MIAIVRQIRIYVCFLNLSINKKVIFTKVHKKIFHFHLQKNKYLKNHWADFNQILHEPSEEVFLSKKLPGFFQEKSNFF